MCYSPWNRVAQWKLHMTHEEVIRLRLWLEKDLTVYYLFRTDSAVDRQMAREREWER